MEKYKLHIRIGGLIAFVIAAVVLLSFNPGMKYDEMIHDRICKIENSHDMARIRLCHARREFTLLVEKEDSLGNMNFEIIRNFANNGASILKKANSNLVRLINLENDELKILFEVKGGRLVSGRIVD